MLFDLAGVPAMLEDLSRVAEPFAVLGVGRFFTLNRAVSYVFEKF